MDCLDCLKKVSDKVITKCEEKLEDYILNYDITKVLPVLEEKQELFVKTLADEASKVAYAQKEYYGGSEIHLYYAVLAFPQNMNFRLKIKNKMKTAKYTNFTNAHQQVIFKRHINDWREVCYSKFIVIPESCQSGDLHFNIIFGSKQTNLKDIIITFTDAYGVKYATKNHFCHVQPVTDLERLINVYMEKKEGKEYQKTGIVWEFQNV